MVTTVLGEQVTTEQYACSTLSELEQAWLGRKNAGVFSRKMLENTRVDPDDSALVAIMQEAMKNTPLRGMVLASGGQFSFKALEALLHLLNMRPLRAVTTLLRRESTPSAGRLP